VNGSSIQLDERVGSLIVDVTEDGEEDGEETGEGFGQRQSRKYTSKGHYKLTPARYGSARRFEETTLGRT
jgi:hypothetical protein